MISLVNIRAVGMTSILHYVWVLVSKWEDVLMRRVLWVLLFTASINTGRWLKDIILLNPSLILPVSHITQSHIRFIRSFCINRISVVIKFCSVYWFFQNEPKICLSVCLFFFLKKKLDPCGHTSSVWRQSRVATLFHSRLESKSFDRSPHFLIILYKRVIILLSSVFLMKDNFLHEDQNILVCF